MLTLKQQREAQKQAKRMKQIERKAKANIKPSPFHKGKLKQEIKQARSLQMRNRVHALTVQGERVSQEQADENYRDNLKMINNLIYKAAEQEESLYFLKMLASAGDIVSALLKEVSPICSQDLKKAVDLSKIELSIFTDWIETGEDQNLSPNQKRQALVWTYQTNELLYRWTSALSPMLYNDIKGANTAYTVCQHFLNWYKYNDIPIILATLDIINGDTLKEKAQAMNMKPSHLKKQILQSSKALYIIGTTQLECKDIKVAHTLSQLKTKAYKWVADFDTLTTIASAAIWQLYRPFAHYYGIDPLNLQNYELEIAKLNRKIMAA